MLHTEACKTFYLISESKEKEPINMYSVRKICVSSTIKPFIPVNVIKNVHGFLGSLLSVGIVCKKSPEILRAKYNLVCFVITQRHLDLLHVYDFVLLCA